MSSIKIKSDFKDYYDKLNDNSSCVIYNRFISESKQRGTALKYLRNIGIKTLDIKPVTSFIPMDGNIVVYTDPKGHNGNGKRIMSVDDAMVYYSNCVASKYYESENSLTLKYLQIGKRRFTLFFKKDERTSLDIGSLIDIKESSSDYNRLIALPIYSIDYIQVGSEMIATDFNEVENLQRIGVDNFLTEQLVIDEIRESMLVYNKV